MTGSLITLMQVFITMDIKSGYIATFVHIKQHEQNFNSAFGFPMLLLKMVENGITQ